MVTIYLCNVLFTQGAVGVVVQTALKTLHAEGVSTGGGDWLIEQPGENTWGGGGLGFNNYIGNTGPTDRVCV